MVKLCLFSSVARIVPITVPRHGKNSLLETLFFCASGPCVHVETHVARTAATLRMTAFASLGCRKRFSVLITSALPHCAARLAEANRAQRPLSTKGDVEKRTRWCIVCVGHHAHIGTRRAGSTHAQHIKTSVRFQAVGVAMIYSNVHEHPEEDFIFFSSLQTTSKAK